MCTNELLKFNESLERISKTAHKAVISLLERSEENSKLMEENKKLREEIAKLDDDCDILWKEIRALRIIITTFGETNE